MPPFRFAAGRVAVIRCKLHLMTEEVGNRWPTISQAKVTAGYCLVTSVVPMVDNCIDDDRNCEAETHICVSLDPNRSGCSHTVCIVPICYLICPTVLLSRSSPPQTDTKKPRVFPAQTHYSTQKSDSSWKVHSN